MADTSAVICDKLQQWWPGATSYYSCFLCHQLCFKNFLILPFGISKYWRSMHYQKVNDIQVQIPLAQKGLLSFILLLLAILVNGLFYHNEN
jgi:hypothetical protein